MIFQSVLLPCSVEAAFRLFSQQINDWWPPERRHLPHTGSVISLGAERFFEADPTGSEVELGAVRSWEPPHRILLDWYPGTGPEHPTQVEIRFVPQANQTLVEVRHQAGPASQELFPTRAPRYEASWSLVLESLRRAA